MCSDWSKLVASSLIYFNAGLQIPSESLLCDVHFHGTCRLPTEVLPESLHHLLDVHCRVRVQGQNLRAGYKLAHVTPTPNANLMEEDSFDLPSTAEPTSMRTSFTFAWSPSENRRSLKVVIWNLKNSGLYEKINFKEAVDIHRTKSKDSIFHPTSNFQ